jgi:hypothetical protein
MTKTPKLGNNHVCQTRSYLCMNNGRFHRFRVRDDGTLVQHSGNVESSDAMTSPWFKRVIDQKSASDLYEVHISLYSIFILRALRTRI